MQRFSAHISQSVTCSAWLMATRVSRGNECPQSLHCRPDQRTSHHHFMSTSMTSTPARIRLEPRESDWVGTKTKRKARPDEAELRAIENARRDREFGRMMRERTSLCG